MIREAVILAGGMGTRLKGSQGEIPKGFIVLESLPIVEWSIQKLISAGIEHIVIGTGYHHEFYDDLAKKYHGVETIQNMEYANTGSMGTLEVAAKKVTQDFLLLESDLIYDLSGLRVLVHHPEANVLLLSGETASGDEVYVQSDANGNLLSLGKEKERKISAAGELVGISKISVRLLKAMCNYAAEHHADIPKMEYESAMQASAKDNPVSLLKIEHFAWREIDDVNHLNMAKNIILPRIHESEDLLRIPREVLLNPGPATTTDSVKYAQVVPDICHREKEFNELLAYTQRELTALVADPSNYETVLFGGSGTAADEAMISSCVGDEDHLLIVDNGAYGARMAKMASVYHLNFDVLKADPCRQLSLETLENALKNGHYTHLAYVFHETTTGVMNPAKEIGTICRRYGVTTIVDAVSAYAGIPFGLEEFNIDFMSSTSNKNIQGMAGLAFVICKKDKLLELKNKPMRCYYLNIYDQYQYFQKTGQLRFTPPVQTFYALRQAITETKIETIPSRYRRYSDVWALLVAASKKIGLKMPVPEAEQAHLVTTFLNPDWDQFDFDTMHDFFLKHHFTIYPGKVSDLPTFRIANIGDIKVEEMKRFISLFEEYFRDFSKQVL